MKKIDKCPIKVGDKIKIVEDREYMRNNLKNIHMPSLNDEVLNNIMKKDRIVSRVSYKETNADGMDIFSIYINYQGEFLLLYPFEVEPLNTFAVELL